MYGTGYRYPRRSRKAYIGDKNAELWAKAAIFNTAVANKNPWVEYLRRNKVYDKIRDELQKARIGYYAERPYKEVSDVDRKLEQLQRQLDTLNEEYGVVKSKAPDLATKYAATKVSKSLSYDKAVSLTTDKLQREIDNLKTRIAELNVIKKQLEAQK
jgi:archaellum component FlaC